MSDEINPGDVVEVMTDPPFTVDDAGVTPVDPSTVKLRWYVDGEPPTVITWTGVDNDIVKVSDGVFKSDILVTKVGAHHFRWEGDGGVFAAAESTFTAVSAFGG